MYVVHVWFHSLYAAYLGEGLQRKHMLSWFEPETYKTTSSEFHENNKVIRTSFHVLDRGVTGHVKIRWRYKVRKTSDFASQQCVG